MQNRQILKIETPATQTVDSVVALLEYCKRPSEPLPLFVELPGSLRLVKGGKGDCFYTTTLKDCSCKARVFNPGKPCKHMALLRAEKDNESIRPTFDTPFRPIAPLLGGV